MAAYILAVPSSFQDATATLDVTRRTADFHPDIWGDRFLSYASESMEFEYTMEEQAQKLKAEVERKMITSADSPSEIMNLIDLIQRLGVSYHFESEIEKALQNVFETNYHSDTDDDLYTVSLRFRLLRQHGFKASCDVFNKFTNGKGNFESYHIKDVRGLLSLYEAAHLRVHGEDILEEALAFATTHLESIAPDLSSPLSEQVSHALKHPIHKRLARLEARHFMSFYQEDPSHDKELLAFAKLDFNLLQKLHKKELSFISRWWKDLNFGTKLSFARDRSVENYFWIMGVYFEPKYSLARRILTKVINMASIIDDIFDAYGKYEELLIFTDAINRWDIGCIDQLPEYMRLCYRALIDVYEEIDGELAKQGRSYAVHYAKEAMKKLVEAYLVEAKWLNKKYVPTVDEYMSNALVSCGYSMLTITSILGMEDVATKEHFDWASNDPKIVRDASIICRLMDDIASHEFEQERGHAASAVECYMKEHGVSEQEACDEFNKQMVDAWKDMNEECLRPTKAPMPLLMRVLNLARVIDLLYKDGDEYTHVGKLMKSCITSTLIDPVEI